MSEWKVCKPVNCWMKWHSNTENVLPKQTPCSKCSKKIKYIKTRLEPNTKMSRQSFNRGSPCLCLTVNVERAVREPWKIKCAEKTKCQAPLNTHPRESRYIMEPVLRFCLHIFKASFYGISQNRCLSKGGNGKKKREERLIFFFSKWTMQECREKAEAITYPLT